MCCSEFVVKRKVVSGDLRMCTGAAENFFDDHAGMPRTHVRMSFETNRCSYVLKICVHDMNFWSNDKLLLISENLQMRC